MIKYNIFLLNLTPMPFTPSYLKRGRGAVPAGRQGAWGRYLKKSVVNPVFFQKGNLFSSPAESNRDILMG
ncbi:MAG: hypothetical protein AB1632_01135 [Nitrospirota bacterium]